MHHSPIGMALVSTDARFLEVNPALCAIVGYTRDELLATTFTALTHPDDLHRRRAQAMTRLLNREIDTHRTVKRYFHKDGRVVWIQLNSSIVRDESDQAALLRHAGAGHHREPAGRRGASPRQSRAPHHQQLQSGPGARDRRAVSPASDLRGDRPRRRLPDGLGRVRGSRAPEDVVRPVAHAGFEDGYLDRVPMSRSKTAAVPP